MIPMLVERPINLAVKTVEEGEIRVQPRPICADVVLEEIEGIFFVVDVSDFEIPVHGVKDLGTEGDVLDFRPPDAFQSHRPSAGAQGFTDHRKHRPALEQGRPLDPKDDAQDILAVEPVGTDFLESELPCSDGSFGHRTVQEEWIGPLSGEDLHAFGLDATLIIHRECDYVARWQRTSALLRLGAAKGAVKSGFIR